MSRNRSGLALVVGTLAAVAATVVPVADATPERVDRRASVIVRGHPGGGSDVAAAVERLGGTVTSELAIVDGVAADVPAGALAELRRSGAVRSLSSDTAVHAQATGASSSTIRSVYPQTIGAEEMWRSGTTGAGTTVAVVDSGIADVPDLAGRVVEVADARTGRPAPCLDLSGEQTCDDTFGHGTFLAGIIAGDGTSSGGRWKGVAPAAELISIKIAGRDGSSDVSKTLAAIQWVVSHKDRYGIDVLNLSLGTDSTQRWDVDPFNYAVQRAWEAGIVVVVAASNQGPAPGTIAKPGDDPWVVTVGSVDDRGTPGTGDDRVPDHTSRGPTAAGQAKPDVAAPGAHIVSLRSPGSTIDRNYPNVIDGTYRRGSGTSMATAAVSGAAALLLDDDPTRRPGDVKGALMATARPSPGHLRAAVGAGTIDIPAAVAPAPGTSGPHRSSGLGGLDASRADVRVRTETLLPVVVGGPLTAQLALWDPLGFVTGSWSTETWLLSPWALSAWYRTGWYGDVWAGVDPGGLEWHGLEWHGLEWHGLEWHGLEWHGDWEGSTSDGDHPGDSYGKPSYGGAWYGVWE